MVGIYIHIPFCKRKCPYCHFYVIPEEERAKERLLTALLQERSRLPDSPVSTLYFGGGTPTLFGIERLEKLLSTFTLAPDCEVTIEANPEEVTLPFMQSLAGIGINRVSIGIQSLDDALLKQLGRTHSAQKAREAVLATHAAGIQNISIDLMYEVPTQKRSQFQETLHQVAELPITHLSLYNLTIEPQTVYHKRRHELVLPTAEEGLAMLSDACELLPALGLERYEISAFARPGYQARHNSGYWMARPFHGLGPSAFSYMDGKRYRNVAHLSRYVQALEEGKAPVDFEEQLPYPDNVHELLAVELRLIRGVDLRDFETRHAPLPATTHETIAALEAEGFITREQERVALNPQGLLFYDTVATRLI